MNDKQVDSAPLLTIAIPTYNRALYLRKLLESLFNQLIEEPRIELIVSDNASVDNTHEAVAEYERRGLRIRLFRNEANLGPDANFLQCFERARGKYVWIFGDDDILPSGSLGIVLGLLNRYMPDFIYVSPMEFRDVLPPASYLVDRHGRSPAIIDNKNRFAQMVGNMLTLVTCNIVNKSRIAALSHAPFEELIGTSLVHLGWSLPLLDDLESGIYVYDQLVAVRAGNRGGYSVVNVFGKNFKTITDYLLGPHSKLTRILQTDVIRYCLTFMILEVRSSRFGDFSEERFHSELQPLYGRKLNYWLFLFPIASGPIWLAKQWFFLIRAFRKMQNLLVPFAFSSNGRMNSKRCKA